jgi:hypothetical protein
MVASARRPVLPTVQLKAASSRDHHHAHPARWVQDVLPFATSLIIHLSTLAIGVALYQVVTLAKPNEVTQVTIPDSTIAPKTNLPPGATANTPLNMVLPDSPHATADMPGSLDSTLKNFESSPGGPADTNPLFRSIESGNTQSGIGNMTGPGTGSGPLHLPQGIGGIPGVKVGDVPGKGRRVIFMCDASGSMLGVFGALKAQMKESINSLDLSAGAEFNVIFFSDDNCFPLFKDGTQMATAENKAKAMEFVDNAVATGGTQPLPAIRFAMAEKPDLMFVLTDGFDQISNFDDVTNAFKKGNPDGKIHVNCIFLESDPDPKLEECLKKIASDKNSFLKKEKADM